MALDEFTYLTDEDRLLLAKDALRGKESDYYRLSLLPEDSGGRLPIIEIQIERLREEVKALEQEVVENDPNAPLTSDVDLHDLTVEQLQNRLRAQDKPTSGTKDELIARLNE